MRRFYVAYGSNLNKEQMKRRCPGARPYGTCILKDHKLMFRGSKSGAYLTVEHERGAKTPVAVWSVTKADELALDRYEGYPSFYYKKESVEVINGEEIVLFMYVMHEDRPYGIPSDSYVETCLQGYKDFNLDKEVLLKALENTKKEILKDGNN